MLCPSVDGGGSCEYDNDEAEESAGLETEEVEEDMRDRATKDGRQRGYKQVFRECSSPADQGTLMGP